VGRNSQQLVSLILSSSMESATEEVLEALAQAAEAAAAAGHPLQLHTLRVLGCRPSIRLASKVQKSLPSLRCLQWPGPACLGAFDPAVAVTADHSKVEEHLGPQQQATQLQEVHMVSQTTCTNYLQAAAGLLPLTLQRLSWWASLLECSLPDLSHLTRLTFLQLDGWKGGSLAASKLPESLQELDLRYVSPYEKVLPEQLQLVTAVPLPNVSWHQLSSLPKLQALRVDADHLVDNADRTVLAQLTSLSALSIAIKRVPHFTKGATMQQVMSTVASIQSLRRLDISIRPGMPIENTLSCMTGLTRLSVSFDSKPGGVEEHPVWAAELGRMPGLQWLSVPDVLLLVPDQSWVGNLTQLNCPWRLSKNVSKDMVAHAANAL
jgi:hypothetical protein